jgi:hypothetical protein
MESGSEAEEMEKRVVGFGLWTCINVNGSVLKK